jgi:hypothetical protein
MSSGSQTFEFSSDDVKDLLTQFDRRLAQRGIAASVVVVGGAAIAAMGLRGDRLTEDVDAITREESVLEEASRLAAEQGLPDNWLNRNASMWMPPLPDGVLEPPAGPGLRITYADAGFLFATKLIAPTCQGRRRRRRSREEPQHAGRATADELEAHIRDYYTDHNALEFILDGDDVDRELRYPAEDAARLLNR